MKIKDNIPLFWDEPKPKRLTKIRPMPPIPDLGWRHPTEFPDLRSASAIGLDTETRDPGLVDFGPGWGRGKGEVVGVSVATPEGFCAYYPVGHTVCPEQNFDKKKVMEWLNWVLSNHNQPKIGANIGYDVGWLLEEGVEVKGPLIDVQFAEALIDGEARQALEVLGRKYVGEGKDSNAMYQWLSEFYGGNPTGKDQGKNIYRAPASMVGFYAESDAFLPLRIWEKQRPILERQRLMWIFNMECELIRVVNAMRRTGVQVDVNATEVLREELVSAIEQEKAKVKHETGIEFNPGAPSSLIKLFEYYDIPLKKTKKTGNYTFAKKYLNSLDHPFIKKVEEIRKYEKFVATFIDSYILESHINGKVHGQFNLLKGDGFGAISGRLSSSKPNLQNIPSRDKVWAPKIRGLFLPDPGHIAWRKYDYSQIEYRLFAHFAVGPQSDDIRAKFVNDPNTDYHAAIIDMIYQYVQQKLERKPAKTINFGLLYGMGIEALAATLGISVEEATLLSEAYHAGVPFAKKTMDYYKEQAERFGEITTIFGRKIRFDKWGPRKYQKDAPTFRRKQAEQIYGEGNIKRAFLHKAVNSQLQGSAADIMKYAMYRCWTEGIFDATGIPKLTVHDELDLSDPGGRDEAFREMRHVMESCVKLSVPVKVDGEIGSNWGNVKEVPGL